jgi:hypothetical protein
MRSEVERMRRWYGDRALDPAIRARYAPFNDQQVDSLSSGLHAIRAARRGLARHALLEPVA